MGEKCNIEAAVSLGFSGPALYEATGEGTPGTAGPYRDFEDDVGITDCERAEVEKPTRDFGTRLAEMLRQLAQQEGHV